MTSDSPDPSDHLDELASALVDGHLRDESSTDEHLFETGDIALDERARRFADVRAMLLDLATGHDNTPAAAEDGRSADRQIDAALAVFDELFAASDRPTPAVPAVTSLDAHRSRRASSRRVMTALGVAAAVALAVFGLSRINTEGSKTSSSAQTSALPALADQNAPVQGTASTKRSPAGAQVPTSATEAASATTSAAGADAAGGATASANAPSAASGPPVLDSNDQLVILIEQTAAFSATTTAATAPPGIAALPSSAGATTAAAVTAAATRATTTPAAASATTTAAATTASASTTAGTTAGTAPAGPPCDRSPNATDVGAVIWQGQLGELFVAPAPNDGAGRVGTVYSTTCAVLTQVAVPF